MAVRLAFKGFLAYLGLRYAFNVLELFAKGRFEGESVDHTLWGRKAHANWMVITLFIVFASSGQRDDRSRSRRTC